MTIIKYYKQLLTATEGKPELKATVFERLFIDCEGLQDEANDAHLIAALDYIAAAQQLEADECCQFDMPTLTIGTRPPKHSTQKTTTVNLFYADVYGELITFLYNSAESHFMEVFESEE